MADDKLCRCQVSGKGFDLVLIETPEFTDHAQIPRDEPIVGGSDDGRLATRTDIEFGRCKGGSGYAHGRKVTGFQGQFDGFRSVVFGYRFAEASCAGIHNSWDEHQLAIGGRQHPEPVFGGVDAGDRSPETAQISFGTLQQGVLVETDVTVSAPSAHISVSRARHTVQVLDGLVLQTHVFVASSCHLRFAPQPRVERVDPVFRHRVKQSVVLRFLEGTGLFESYIVACSVCFDHRLSL